MGRRVGQYFEGEGLQSVTSQNSGSLVKLDVVGRLAATQVIIIHGRQVIMDQRITMHQLDGSASSQTLGIRYIKQARRLNSQKGPKPLAAIQRGIGHRLTETRLRALSDRKQALQR